MHSGSFSDQVEFTYSPFNVRLSGNDTERSNTAVVGLQECRV